MRAVLPFPPPAPPSILAPASSQTKGLKRQFPRSLLALVILLMTTGAHAQGPASEFNYKDNDPEGYAAAKRAFKTEYQKVVDYLVQTEGGDWGFTDILNLWDYRTGLRQISQGKTDDPDNIFTIARQIQQNMNDGARKLSEDMRKNEEYYQIKLLMLIAKPFSEKRVWNPVANHQEHQSMVALRDVINRLKLSGKSVEEVERLFPEYERFEKGKKNLAIREALNFVKFKEKRCLKLIEARHKMYRQAPASGNSPVGDTVVEVSPILGHWKGIYLSTRGDTSPAKIDFHQDSAGQLFVNYAEKQTTVFMRGKKFFYKLEFENIGSYTYEGSIPNNGTNLTISYINHKPPSGEVYTGTITFQRKRIDPPSNPNR